MTGSSAKTYTGELGMTIVELAMSVVILTILTLSIYPLFEAGRMTYSSNSSSFTAVAQAQRGIERMKEDISQTSASFLALDPTNRAIAFPLMRIESNVAPGGVDLDQNGYSDDFDGFEMDLNNMDGDASGHIEVINEAGNYEVFPVWKALCIYCPSRLQEDLWQLKRYVVTATEVGVGLNADSLPIASVTIHEDTNGWPINVEVVLSDGSLVEVGVTGFDDNRLRKPILNALDPSGAGQLVVQDEVLASYLATIDEDNPNFVSANVDTIRSLQYQLARVDDAIQVYLPIEKAPEMRLRQGTGQSDAELASQERNTVEASLSTVIVPAVE